MTATARSFYRRTPCDECPWRTDRPGQFSAERFRALAGTAYDMATRVFACHKSATKAPAYCAGFLLRAHHNLTVRMAMSRGDIDAEQISDGGHRLHKNYRAMAIANGCDENEPELAPCR